ncbi:sterol O-acyltransferase 1 [Bombus terrestris]|uniref:O-acyltransferase n=1 Tax=Bombus terrestris TaxID=30195 RepID=A0A9B2MNZ2_BOMTE|nr:sterol O-acyltransferase 1 [Bombus terrestris]XP_012168813.1 sterol O-acyltransferase 1 [Bombus terrestris]XP_012168814.1 sterol O-acyltransferase 1 [Bombus terrestris]
MMEHVTSENTNENTSETQEDPKTQNVELTKFKQCGVRDIIINEVQGQMQEIRQDILEIINSQMNDMMSEIMSRFNSTELKDLTESEKYSNRTKATKENMLPTKQFLQRNSLLTDLYEIKHIRTLYNAIVAMLIILLIHTAVYDIRHTGSPNLGIDTVRAGFAKFPIVLLIWTLMKLSVLGVYPAFCCWATRRLKYEPNSFAKELWDYVWLTGIILYLTFLFILPTKALLDNDLPFASSMIILMEQVRLVMKIHAFIRSVAPKFLSFKPHSDTPTPQPPDFSKYLYFLFAPTLIYQDRYPRLKRIRWNIVLSNFVEVITIIIFVALLYERLLYPNYRDFGKHPVEVGKMMLNILSSMLPGILMFVCGFYLLLHCWMNASAELLRFADKMFYKDWWNSICFSTYYRTWNIVVHDWLYTYIYKDMYEILTPGNRTISTCAVFAISAIIHEYILSFTTHFFYPVMLILFGVIGLTVVFVLKTAGNVFLWFSLSVGNGVMVSLYCMEYFARINCPPVRDDFWDVFIPRSWACVFK